MAANSGPGIARADRPRNGDFSGLLTRARDDEDALDGLLFAYESMPEDARAQLVRAVAQDLTAPGSVLGLLLAVEPNPSLRQEIAALARRAGVPSRRAAVREAHTEGEAHLIQAGLDGLFDKLEVRWNHNEIVDITVETTEDSRFEGLDGCDPSRVVDTLTPMLWRYLHRGGRLPKGASRFAAWFDLGAP